MLSFKPAFLLGSLFTLHFLPLEGYHLHIWGCWYFSLQSWFQPVIPLAQYFEWYTLDISYISRVTIYSLVILFSQLEPVHCSMSSSNCCFLTCIQASQEADKMVRYLHLFKNFAQFGVIHTVKSFSIVNEAEVDVFLELCCFFDEPTSVGNLTSGSSAFSKSSLNIWKFGQLSCFFLHTWLVHRPFLRCVCNFFSKMDPTTEACRHMSTLIMGRGPHPFWPPRSLITHVQRRESFLDLRWGTFSLHFSRAQLLPLALSLQCLSENKAWSLFPLTKQ